MKQLMSRWGEKLDREMVWKEYPRPGLVTIFSSKVILESSAKIWDS